MANGNPEKKEIMAGALKSAETLNTKELTATLQAVIENLEEALKKEKGENTKKIEEKLAEAKQLKQKLIDIGKSLLTAKGGNEKAKSKAREEIKNIIGKLDVLLDARESIEGLKSEIKKPKTKELPTEEELEQVADKTKDFETMEKWKEKFVHTAEFAGLSKESAEIYWQAYLDAPYLEFSVGVSALPFGGRLSPDKISKELKKAFSKYDKKVSDVALLKRAKIEAFGKLVNGENANLVNDDVKRQYELYCEEKIEKIREQIQKKGAELEKQSEKFERTKASVEKLLKTISSFTKANPSPYNIFGTSLSLEIRQSIGLLDEYNNEIIPDLKAGVDKIESSMKALTGDLFSIQLELLSHQGADTTRFLLEVGDTLGDDLPPSLKAAVEKNKQNYLAFPNVISEFDRLFYGGQYDKALELLAKQNKERSNVKWLPINVGEQDVLSKYRSQGKFETGFLSLLTINPKNSFVKSKIAEGYKIVRLKEVDPSTFDGNIVKSHRGSYNCVLVREYKDGSIGYIPILTVTASGETLAAPSPRDGTEHIISPEKISEIENRNEELKGNLRKVIASNPSFKKLSDAGKVLQEQFGPLQKLFAAGIEGNKTKNFVELAREYATKIKISAGSGELHALRANLKLARKDIYALREFVHTGNYQPGVVDEFEQEILKLEESFKNIESLVGGTVIEKICAQISSADFSQDTLDRWLVKNAIPFVAMLALAVAGAMLFMPLAGVMTSAIVALGGTAGAGVVIFTTSAAGALGATVGGAVGMELGTFGSHYLGKAIYGNDFSNRTLLGKKLFEGEDIDWSKIAKVYGKDLAMKFVFTFALMGAGQVAGRYLSRFVNIYGNNEGLRGGLANALKKIPKLSEHRVDITASNFLGKFTRELLEESGEEITEAVAQNVNSWLGSFAQFYNCLDGRKVRQNMGGFDITQGRSVQIGNVIEKHWTFDAADAKAFEQTMRYKYEGQGFKVDGLVATSEFVSKTGKKIVTRLVFEASPESGSMRQMFTEGIDKTGKSEAERLYGVERVPGRNNEYVFSTLSPDKKITLAKYLQRRGFVIQGDINSGRFVAVSGDQQLTFSQKSLAFGTNNTNMENTKPETLDNAGLAVPANAETQPTVGSPVIDELQAGVKSSINVAEVERRLSERGLPEDFFGGELSPAEQLQVLSDVEAMEGKALSASNEYHLIQAEQAHARGEEYIIPEGAGLLGSAELVSLLDRPNGKYEFAVLLAGMDVIPPFNYDQVLKIGEADQGLADVVVEGMLRADPAKFNELRQAFYQDLFARFGGKEELERLARDVYERISDASAIKIAKTLRSFAFSPRGVAILLAGGYSLSSSVAYADVSDGLSIVGGILTNDVIVTLITVVAAGGAVFGIAKSAATKGGSWLGAKLAALFGFGRNVTTADTNRRKAMDRVRTTQNEILGTDNPDVRLSPPIRRTGFVQPLDALFTSGHLRDRINTRITAPGNAGLAVALTNFNQLVRALQNIYTRTGSVSLDQAVIDAFDGVGGRPGLFTLLSRLNASTTVDQAAAILLGINGILAANPNVLNGLLRPVNRGNVPNTRRFLADIRPFVVRTEGRRTVPVENVIANEDVRNGLNARLNENTNKPLEKANNNIHRLHGVIGDLLGRWERGEPFAYPGDLNLGHLSGLLADLDGVIRIVHVPNNITDTELDLIIRAMLSVSVELERVTVIGGRETTLIDALSNPVRPENAESLTERNTRRRVNILLIALLASSIGAGISHWWPEEKEKPAEPEEGTAQQIAAANTGAGARQNVEFRQKKRDIISGGEDSPVNNERNRAYIEKESGYSELVGILKTYIQYIPSSVYQEAVDLSSQIQALLNSKEDQTAQLKTLIQKMNKLGLDKMQKDVTKNPQMHANTPDWLRSKPSLYAQIKFLRISLKGKEPESLVNLGTVVTQDSSTEKKAKFLDDFNGLEEDDKLDSVYAWIEDSSKVFLESVK